jgi:hypothetical protein
MERRESRSGGVAKDRRVTQGWTLRGLDAAMLGGVALLAGLNVASALIRAGWVTAALTDVVASGYLLGVAARSAWRPVVGRLLVFGAVAGVLELATDAAGVGFAHTLAYPGGSPFVWASPAYMPLSWMVVFTTVGYLGWRLRAAGMRPVTAMVATALWAGVNIPIYEEMAYHAGWWHYAPAAGWGHTPFYVMLFEGLIGASLPVVLGGLEHRRWWTTAVLGVVEGAWMPAAALAAWVALGR